METDRTPHTVLTLRHATADDAAAVDVVAQRDSAPVPPGDLLVAALDGTVVAAVSLQSGALVADPFRQTADVVALLRERAATLQGARGRGRTRRGLPRSRGAGLVPWARLG